MSTTDRIEKTVVLRSPVSRVWSALADSERFGAWFGVAMEGPFEVGRATRGRITNRGYEHLTMEVSTVAMEPDRYLAFRWHPYAVDPAVDYSGEPTTLVELRLEPVPEGTRLTLVESGFDAIPVARRAEAFRMNDGGWTAQMENIRRHVGG